MILKLQYMVVQRNERMCGVFKCTYFFVTQLLHLDIVADVTLLLIPTFYLGNKVSTDQAVFVTNLLR